MVDNQSVRRGILGIIPGPPGEEEGWTGP